MLPASHLLAASNGNCKGWRKVEHKLEKNLFLLTLSNSQNNIGAVDLIPISLQLNELLSNLINPLTQSAFKDNFVLHPLGTT